MENFGKRLTARRKQLKMSQAELAKRLGMARTSVTQWETGGKIPSVTALDHLTKILDVSMDWLTGKYNEEEQQFMNEIEAKKPVAEIAADHEISYKGHVLDEEQKKWLIRFLDTALEMKNSVKKE